MASHFTGDYDPDAAHNNADRLLCEQLRRLGYGDAVAVFEAAKKWYS